MAKAVQELKAEALAEPKTSSQSGTAAGDMNATFQDLEAAFEMQRKELEGRRSRTPGFFLSEDKDAVLELNVGGQNFATLRATLLKEEGSVLANLANQKEKVLFDKKGRVFLDRPPGPFETILNYLRTGHLVLPVDLAGLQQLLIELDFYNVPSAKRLAVVNFWFEGSSLLSVTELQLLQSWLPTQYAGKRWRVRYRGSHSSFSAQRFHEECDNKGASVVLVQSQSGDLFGGFTSLPWKSSSAGEYGKDPLAFLFSLLNPAKAPFRAPIKANGVASAAFYLSAVGPSFGHGHDMHVDLNARTVSFSNPSSYQSASAMAYSTAAPLAQIREIEVFLEAH